MELQEKLKGLIYKLYNGYTDNQLGMPGMYAEVASGLEECIVEIQKLVDIAKERSENWDIILHT
jgi:hypothetical protein